MGFLYGRFGLPLPRQSDVYMVTGKAIPVNKMARTDPNFEKEVRRSGEGGEGGRLVHRGQPTQSQRALCPYVAAAARSQAPLRQRCVWGSRPACSPHTCLPLRPQPGGRSPFLTTVPLFHCFTVPLNH